MTTTTVDPSATAGTKPEPKPSQDPAPKNTEPVEQPGRTFTQDEVNAIAATERRKAEERFAGYEDLKAKAEQFDAAQDAAKTDLQRATERAEAAEKRAHALLVEAVAASKGVPASHIVGNTREALEASADQLLAWRGTPSTPGGDEQQGQSRQIKAPRVPRAGTGTGDTSRGGSLQAGRERARARREGRTN